MNPNAATDFVTQVCSHACHRKYALGKLHEAGHQFAGAASHGQWVLIVAVLALVVMVALIIRDRARRGA